MLLAIVQKILTPKNVDKRYFNIVTAKKFTIK